MRYDEREEAVDRLITGFFVFLIVCVVVFMPLGILIFRVV